MGITILPKFITWTCLTALGGPAVCALMLGTVSPANASGISFIRDAEIEHNIHQIAAPLFAAAGLDTSTVKIHLVNDQALNAFVAGGQRIFINTGLLLKVEDVSEISGVFAHETGHISGGHLARTHEAIRDASAASILSAVLGAAVALGGQSRTASAIIVSGQSVAQRNFLKYTRMQEAAADQAAVKILAAVNKTAEGLYVFLDRIGDQEALTRSRQDPYVRSHPLTRDRLRFLRNQIERSHLSGTSPDPLSKDDLVRMQAKIRGFLEMPQKTLRRYPESDQTIPAKYARAAALHRLGRTDEALTEAEDLVNHKPEDAYFNELKGQILFESGRVNQAVRPYQVAVRIRPTSPLLRIGLAQAQIATDDANLLPESIKHLEEATRRDKSIPIAWRQLAIALGRNGDIGRSALASAEYNLLIGRNRDSARFATKAENLLSPGTPSHLRAQDLKNLATKTLERRRK